MCGIDEVRDCGGLSAGFIGSVPLLEALARPSQDGNRTSLLYEGIFMASIMR